ncbi:MAG: SGNH/GDSL hydrolase family protein [Atopobiaceae bacterium]|nr:SGNH/GDSL hydrolase family protein [Atopobiaceae bacterium]
MSNVFQNHTGRLANRKAARHAATACALGMCGAALFGAMALPCTLARASSVYPVTDAMTNKQARKVEFQKAIAWDRTDRLPYDHGYDDWYENLREEANRSYTGVSATDQREIACWGDSMTEGIGSSEASVKLDGDDLDVSFMGFPQVLQKLTGLKTYNFGVPAATSEEIALMQGGLGLGDLHEALRVFDAKLAYEGSQHPGDILILEIGSNGGWDNKYKRLANQYKAMIEHAGCDKYLIVGDTDDPGTSIGDLRQQAFEAGTGSGETAWEAALHKTFGDRFINMRVYLIEHGLEVAGLEETKADRDMASRGCVSEQLRADWTHLNSYGYYAQAMGIYERGLRLGYWLPEADDPLDVAAKLR